MFLIDLASRVTLILATFAQFKEGMINGGYEGLPKKINKRT